MRFSMDDLECVIAQIRIQQAVDQAPTTPGYRINPDGSMQRFKFGLGPWCSTVEEAKKQGSKQMKIDLTAATVLAAIDIFAHHHGISAGTVSYRISGNGSLVTRLRAGHDLTLRRTNQILQHLSDFWPDHKVKWPENLPRP